MGVTAGYRRTAAVGTAVSATLHLLMIGHGTLLWGLLMATMAVACFPCATRLWRRPAMRTWMALGAMNASMLLIHLVLRYSGCHGAGRSAGPDNGPISSTGVSHAHHAEGMSVALGGETLFHIATFLSAFEVVAAMAALCLLRRARLEKPRQGG